MNLAAIFQICTILVAVCAYSHFATAASASAGAAHPQSTRFNPGNEYDVTKLRHVKLKPNTALRLTLLPKEKLEIVLNEIHPSVTHIVFQVHTQYKNVTASLNPEWKVDKSVSGNAIGLITVLDPSQTEVKWWVNNTAKPDNVTILLLAHTYTATDPVPGGCNLEFNLQIDPNIHLQSAQQQTVIKFQYANIGRPRGQLPGDCEDVRKQSRLQYHVYALYLTGLDQSEYLNTIESILNPDHLRKRGKLVTTIEHGSSRTNVSMIGFPRQGTIYGVVVEYMEKGSPRTFAGYVPVSTYTCKFIGQVNNCYDSENIPVRIAVVVAGFAGLLLCMFGHKFFKTEMFVFGGLAVVLVVYVLLTRYTTLSEAGVIPSCVACAVVGGGLWLALWWFVGVPVVSVLLSGLVSGWLCAAVAFSFTPFGELTVWKNDFNFGMAFACGLLIIPVIFLCFTHKLSIIACSLIGSYATVLVLDLFLAANLKYIVLVTMWKFTIPDFTKAHTLTPFHDQDIVLCCVWVLLFAIGISAQLWCSKGKPQFPPPPYATYKARRLANLQREPPPWRGSHETEPLLWNRSHRSSTDSQSRPAQPTAPPDMLVQVPPPVVQPL